MLRCIHYIHKKSTVNCIWAQCITNKSEYHNCVRPYQQILVLPPQSGTKQTISFNFLWSAIIHTWGWQNSCMLPHIVKRLSKILKTSISTILSSLIFFIKLLLMKKITGSSIWLLTWQTSIYLHITDLYLLSVEPETSKYYCDNVLKNVLMSKTMMEISVSAGCTCLFTVSAMLT